MLKRVAAAIAHLFHERRSLIHERGGSKMLYELCVARGAGEVGTLPKGMSGRSQSVRPQMSYRAAVKFACAVETARFVG